MSRPLLSLTGVSKRYPPTVHSGERLRAFWQLLLRGQAEGGTTVLEDIGFDIMPGESLAVVGSNGAGKSTLLKIITGVLAPTTGHVEQRGSVAALLELGAGFDPEYSGMENLRMNAAFLGLSPKQVDDRLDDILAFADIGESIHEPVKHYSSGMVVRLGFAVVTSVRPDLLITDEVLAVGDESFQKKCIRWIEQYLADGGTMLMVSHNTYQIQKLCRHALWLDGGRVRASGDVFDVTQSYLAWHERKSTQERESQPASLDMPRVTGMELELGDGGSERIPIGGSLSLQVRLSSPDERAPVLLVGIVRVDGTPVYGTSTDQDRIELVPVCKDTWGIGLRLEALPLLPGNYHIRVSAMDAEGLRVCDTQEREFAVRGETRELGIVRLEHHWTQPKPATDE